MGSSVGRREEPLDAVEEALRDRRLAQQREVLLRPVAGQDGDPIGVRPEPAARFRDVVGADQVQPFGHQLAPRLRQHVPRFGGEAHLDQGVAVGAVHGLEHVRVLHQVQVERRVGRGLLDLLRRHRLGAEVGHGGRHDQGVGSVAGGEHGRLASPARWWPGAPPPPRDRGGPWLR